MKKDKLGFLYSLPLSIWLVVFFIAPMIIVLIYAFLKKGTYGGVEFEFTLKSFSVFTNKTFITIFIRTIIISIFITIFTVGLAIPSAYFIARSKYKQELLFLIIIPFWTNLLIRIYAWIAILGNNGLINEFLIKSGISKEPLQLLYNITAVVIISVYTNLPFAILPLYAVIEKFDFSLMEAARDLGASNMKAFFKVFLPNIKPGIVTAVLFTFIPSLGSYAVPKLVGGTKGMMLGDFIARQLLTTKDWPKASAISAILILLTSFTILLYNKNSKKEKLIKVMDDE
ncbi:ABC transporter permease [Fusobacterium sp. PH5-44]|uniref:ABC transporter permease n=1 Tax=unclassified Fusobacterium TaxID=2648384 RepID=UPI003D1F2659